MKIKELKCKFFLACEQTFQIAMSSSHYSIQLFKKDSCMIVKKIKTKPTMNTLALEDRQVFKKWSYTEYDIKSLSHSLKFCTFLATCEVRCQTPPDRQ